MKRWNAIAYGGTGGTRSADWTRRLPAGSTLTSVAYSTDPDDGNLSFTSNTVTSGVSSVLVKPTDEIEREYKVKCVPTLDVGSISPVTIRIKIVKHKET